MERAPSLPARFDLEDGFIVSGVLLAEFAAGVIWWPAALILGAIFCFAFAILIEIEKAAKAKRGHSEP